METYNRMAPIVEKFVIDKYQKRFGDISNGRQISYVDMVTETHIDEDKKKSKLRDINIEILEGGDEEKLKEKIENIDEIVIEEQREEIKNSDNDGTLWGNIGHSTGNYVDTISPQVKMKNLNVMDLVVTMKDDLLIDESAKIDYIIQFLDGQIHQEFKKIISTLPVVNIEKKFGLYTEQNQFMIERRAHPKSYYGNLTFLESRGLRNLEQFEHLEFLQHDEVLLIPEQKKFIFSYLNFASDVSMGMGNTVTHRLRCTIDLIAKPEECILLKLNNNLL